MAQKPQKGLLNRRQFGGVIQEGERVTGDGVHMAACVESLAETGGICISGSAFAQIENTLALGYQDMWEHAVKISGLVGIAGFSKNAKIGICRRLLYFNRQ